VEGLGRGEPREGGEDRKGGRKRERGHRATTGRGHGRGKIKAVSSPKRYAFETVV
jgi:hypothetical protein